MIQYKPKYFTLEELNHPELIAALGEVNCWLRWDADVLRDIDYIREEWYFLNRSGVYVNRLNYGLDSRGARPVDDPDGAEQSTHKSFNTVDMEPVNGKHKSFYNFVKGLMKAGKLKALNTLEDFEYTKTWVHAAKMNTSLQPLIIKP